MANQLICILSPRIVVGWASRTRSFGYYGYDVFRTGLRQTHALPEASKQTTIYQENRVKDGFRDRFLTKNRVRDPFGNRF